MEKGREDKKMGYSLLFNPENYRVESVEAEGHTVVYRAYEDLVYVERPVAEEYQRMNIYVPELLMEGGTIGRYDRHTAPVFLANTVGGYMPGKPEKPGNHFMGKTNALFFALQHGCVAVSVGARGRGLTGADGSNIGCAPACIVDLKAAVRYLKYNRERICGNMSRIISNGTSAGGALSALLGVTGNHPDYESYLDAAGAAEAGDDIYAVSCYCPITNLEHGDMAYEWEFNGLHDYRYMRFDKDAETGEMKRQPVTGTQTEEQKKLSAELKKLFPSYVNSLHLTDERGNDLILEEDGNGSFQQYIKDRIMESIQKAMEGGMDFTGCPWIQIRDGKAVDVDFAQFTAFRTRMKTTPAFDDVWLQTPENELFGTDGIASRHFTRFSLEHTKAEGEMAEEGQIRRMNPMNYIGDSHCDTAPCFRIRHGASDRDTSLAVSALLAAALKKQGIQVDYHLPWGLPHAGDYDLPELFAWIDRICNV
ncbi:subtype B tannase [Eisenbergiella sp.]|uniref:subtype B tannase n=1 Tax=Eisenbergiella sp. TaxID=1924109 RepID=UPI002A7EFFD9|nr:subtype B tannase [Eisenbergiella sp.]